MHVDAARVQQAAQLIFDLPRDAAQTLSLHAAIDDACTALLNFLRLSCLGTDDKVCLDLLAFIVDSEFLSRVFYQRAMFRTRCKTGTISDNTFLVVWADDLLVAIGDVPLALVTQEDSFYRAPETLLSLQETTKLRAATQLPECWDDLHTVLTDPGASPAAKRLATSILYASYCLHFIISPCPPTVDARALSVSLRGYIHEISATSGSNHQRLNHAMLISLYALVDSLLYKTQKPLLVPRTMEILKSLLVAFFPAENTSQTYDAVQTLILQWSSVLPWAWRVLHSDLDSHVVANLTSTWISHCVHARHSVSTSCDDGLRGVTRDIIRQLRLRSFGPLDVGHHLETCLDSELGVDHLLQICTTLVILNEDDLDSYNPHAARHMCLHFFHHLNAPELAITTLEYICLGGDQVRSILDPVDSWWAAASNAFQTIIIAANEKVDFQRVRFILDFAAILAHAFPDQRSQGRPLFGAPLKSWLTKQCGERQLARLLPSALQLWALLAPAPLRISLALWNVIAAAGPDDIWTASAFAHFVAGNGGLPVECHEEAFDYLRDAFLISTAIWPAQQDDSCPSLNSKIALGLIVAPTFCRALGVLVGSMSPDSARYSLSSPMTEALLSACNSPRLLSTRAASSMFANLQRVAREIGTHINVNVFLGPNVRDNQECKISIAFERREERAHEYTLLLIE